MVGTTKTPWWRRIGGDKLPDDEDMLSPRHVMAALAGLPRVMRLVWQVSPFFTTGLGALYILQGFVPVATAIITSRVIDAVNAGFRLHGGGETVRIVVILVIAQFALQGFSNLLQTVSNIWQQLLQEKMSYQIQLLVMEKANTLDLSFFENAAFYDKMQQAQQEAASRPTGMISQTFSLGQTLVTFLSMGVLLLSLAWWVAVLALIAPIPVFIANMRYGWWGFQVMRRQSPQRREMQYYTNLLTTDTYNKEIKLFTSGPFFIQLYRELAAQFYQQAKKLLVPRYMTSFWLGVITVIANGGIYLYVALQAAMGKISLGKLTLYTQAALSVGSSFQGLLGGISSTYENTLFVNTLFDFLEYEPRIVSPPNGRTLEAGQGLEVEFRHVSFMYPGREDAGPVLRDVSFTIHAGEAVALVGRNGAGKTTIVKLLTRLYDPDEGEILINGHDIKEYNLESLRSQVGVIFQDYVTYFMTASRNIGIGQVQAMNDEERIEAAATKSGADGVIAKLPDHYDTMLGKWFDRGQQLSGGEWQKIALARAFMRDAGLLILDEPTSSLDPQSEFEVFTHFRELTAGKSAIFISHRFSTVRLANRIIVLENGVVLEEGPHDELLARNGRYAELFNLQAEAYR